MTAESFLYTVECIEQQLHAQVDEGSDQELFISSYLLGHFSLQVANAELENDWDLGNLDTRMQTSLQQAFNNKELEAADQHQVVELWQHLLNLE